MLNLIYQLDTPTNFNQYVEGINRMKGLTELQENLLEKQIQDRFSGEKYDKIQQLKEMKILKGHKFLLKQNIEIIAKKTSSTKNEQYSEQQQPQQQPQLQLQQQQQFKMYQQQPTQSILKFIGQTHLNHNNTTNDLNSDQFLYQCRNNNNNPSCNKFLYNNNTNYQNSLPYTSNIQNNSQIDGLNNNNLHAEPQEIQSKRKVSDLFNELYTHNSNQLENFYQFPESQQVVQQQTYPELLNSPQLESQGQKFLNHDTDYFMI
eukprot:TRINITY_DN5554_c0_g1_i1.p1 TRINITY_DN5554_c0_g1~~TRINITY_DN5554_c0_g1_i1.p1  ORF type:complete len:261 (+),score=52.17 TRINITY_DN5554_c0_g1_i1:417-1199(+)